MSLALCLLCGSSCSDVSPLSATVHSLHRLIGYPTLTTAAQHKWHYLGIKLYVWPIITSDTSPLQTVQCSPVLLPPPPCSTLPSLTHSPYTDHPSRGGGGWVLTPGTIWPVRRPSDCREDRAFITLIPACHRSYVSGASLCGMYTLNSAQQIAL